MIFDDPVVELPRWAKRRKAELEKRGEKFDAREVGIIAQWPEDWVEYHTRGLEYVVMSGCVLPSLFTEDPRGNAMKVASAFPRRGETSWVHVVAGRLLAGVGAEILLKGLYLKRGYSIRQPDEPAKQALAQLGPDARRFNPRMSASFGTILRDHNLKLLGEPRDYKPFTVAKWWRDEGAHTAVTHTWDAVVHLVKFGMSLRFVHSQLLQDAEAGHVAAVDEILRDRGSIF